MRPATRYALAGIAALALLQAVQYLRTLDMPRPPVIGYLLGVLPNFAAAIAITFVLLGIWSQGRDADAAVARRRFLIYAAFSGLGLLAWEVFQKTSRRLIYDPDDIAATGVGILVAGLVFRLLTPRPAAPPDRRGRS